MASDKRPLVKLRSTAGTGYQYWTTKNKTNTNCNLSSWVKRTIISAFSISGAATQKMPGSNCSKP